MKPKIGLALGSGGVRGFAHIGVLKVLKEEGIHVDYIAGSSMGALVGVLFGSGYDAGMMEKMALQFRRKYLLDFTVPKMGFIKGEKAKQIVQMLVHNKKLEQLDPKVHVVATDLKKGERIIFKEGDIASAVRASIAIPGIVVPETIDGRMYVDGGVIDRVPVSVVKEMGADIIIAVDVSFLDREPEIASVYDVIMQSMDIMEREMVRYREIESDIMIKPILSHIRSTQFTNVQEIIQNGEEETKKLITQLKEKIQRWKEKQHD
ncbi:patatin-like phospholipase family protein [Evansella cellulosilytica]|uniref:Patatin n=1 Tax=Evansella cellulosilytica (strain ATCC 21833 / DSM 2522 / FERM P-1141 / JCM 9156 / N-4) TaxID=649639 RepID=E6TUH9_EVAC2|nr:patatin-like phospholipase family protein [Evansella cellulosilytica]ADU30869.1 Patatin [Evansella cellulosilytica DSM 2522]